MCGACRSPAASGPRPNRASPRLRPSPHSPRRRGFAGPDAATPATPSGRLSLWPAPASALRRRRPHPTAPSTARCPSGSRQSTAARRLRSIHIRPRLRPPRPRLPRCRPVARAPARTAPRHVCAPRGDPVGEAHGHSRRAVTPNFVRLAAAAAVGRIPAASSPAPSRRVFERPPPPPTATTTSRRRVVQPPATRARGPPARPGGWWRPANVSRPRPVRAQRSPHQRGAGPDEDADWRRPGPGATHDRCWSVGRSRQARCGDADIAAAARQPSRVWRPLPDNRSTPAPHPDSAHRPDHWPRTHSPGACPHHRWATRPPTDATDLTAVCDHPCHDIGCKISAHATARITEDRRRTLQKLR